MLLLPAALVALVLLFALAHRRARIIRLRLDRRPAALALGSWEAPDALPAQGPVPAAG